MSRERGILFSSAMVRALLAGTKTQTRRVVKPPRCAAEWDVETLGRPVYRDSRSGAQHDIDCHYGRPGDRLWVREAWGYFDPDGTGEDHDNEHETPGPGPAAYCDELLQEGHPLRDFWRRRVAYKATFAEGKYGKGPASPNKWRHAIYMPRWASRITLELTAVRVERLQEISEADAIAEGVNVHPDHHSKPRTSIYGPVQAYRDLWESINGVGSWDANPWVWALTFRRVT